MSHALVLRFHNPFARTADAGVTRLITAIAIPLGQRCGPAGELLQLTAGFKGWVTRMVVAQLTSSAFFGGPGAQMVGLALNLPSSFRTVFILFRDKGKSRDFREKLEGKRIQTHVLDHDTPRVQAMASEVASVLRAIGTDVLCTHGYKGDLVGLLAARRFGIPIIAVSRGWTGETRRVRVYEAIDRACLRRMDRVVCVSEGQACKVRLAGVAADRVVVIHNAIRADRFARPDLSAGAELRPCSLIRRHRSSARPAG